MHLVEVEPRVVRHDRLDRIEDRIDHAVAGGRVRRRGALDIHLDSRRMRALRAGRDGERDEPVAVVGMHQLVVDQRGDVLVVDRALAVGEILEAAERVVQRVVAELVAQLPQLVAERRATRVLAHDKRGLGDAHCFGPHDLVGRLVLQHAVLMNAALMREGVAADDRLVELHRERRHRRHDLRRAVEHRRHDTGAIRQDVRARRNGHHHLFERRVARPLADAVDGAFDLPRAAAHPGERIRHRQAEVVVAMDGEDRLVRIRHALAHFAEHRLVFVGRGIADRVGNVDRRRAGFDRRLHAATQEIALAARAVFGRPFHVLDVVARARHGGDGEFENLLRLHLQLVLHVDRRCREKDVDARLARVPHRFGATIDVAGRRAGEARDRGVLYAPRDLGDSLEIALAGDREAGLDDVDAHRV